MSSYPYIGQLGPAVGGGLGGIPRRPANVVDAPYVDRSLIRNSLLDVFSGVDSTTYPGAAIISDDIFVLMTSGACCLKQGVSGGLVVNASLQSFFGGTTISARTLFRLTGSNYVIANTSASGSWKLWLLKVNDFSLPLGSITFTPVMDITSLSLFAPSYGVRLSSCINLGSGKYLISSVTTDGGGGSTGAAMTVSIGVDTLSLISTSSLTNGLLFPVKKYKNCFFVFERSTAGGSASISAFLVNDSGVILDLSGVFGHSAGTNAKIVALDSESVTFDDGNKYTVDINTKSLVNQTGVYYTGRISFNPYSASGYNKCIFSTDQAMIIGNAAGTSDGLFIIRPDAESGYLYGERMFTAYAGSYAGSYGKSFFSRGTAGATYYREI